MARAACGHFCARGRATRVDPRKKPLNPPRRALPIRTVLAKLPLHALPGAFEIDDAAALRFPGGASRRPLASLRECRFARGDPRRGAARSRTDPWLQSL